MLRAPGGQLIDSEGTVLMNLDHTPVYTHNDRRAVRTGNREPEPCQAALPREGEAGPPAHGLRPGVRRTAHQQDEP